jgi:hypothetical protein
VDKLFAMNALALNFLIVAILAVHPAYGADISFQPLTRADCSRAEMAWDESANACGANSAGDFSGQPLTRLDCVEEGMQWNDSANVCGTIQAAETIFKPEAPDDSSQPLARNHCEMAGLSWNDQANVCGESGATTQDTTSASSQAASPVLINIDKARQRMVVFVDGAEQYNWPVSTGLRGYSTPSGSYTASSMNEMWYSKEWDDAPMPHAVFFTKEGHAIHGTNEVKRLGRPASHGCVRISPKNAATLYSLVAKNGLEQTQIELVGITPGGEGKLASSARSKPGGGGKVASSARSKPRYRAESYVQPQRRGGLFRRLFGRR